jgi:hypothetical protein
MLARTLRPSGSIEELPSGSCRAVVYAGIGPLTGKPRTLYETVPSYDAGEKVFTKLHGQVDADKHPKSAITVRQAMERRWSWSSWRTRPGAVRPARFTTSSEEPSSVPFAGGTRGEQGGHRLAPSPSYSEPDPPSSTEAAVLLNVAWTDPDWGLLLWPMITGCRLGSTLERRRRRTEGITRRCGVRKAPGGGTMVGTRR